MPLPPPSPPIVMLYQFDIAATACGVALLPNCNALFPKFLVPKFKLQLQKKSVVGMLVSTF